MSVAGLKKQFHKATQKVSEKVGGAEGTKLDDDFKEMEKKVDITSRATLDIMTKTTEYLQPNPGLALMDAGESMTELGEVKDALDMEVKQNFIDPLQNLHDKDLKEIQHHLKKMEGRRLDFDYKKKRQGKVQDEELKQALEKFDESKEVAEQSMFNLLESDIEQVSQLAALVQAQLQYHSRAAELLQQLSSSMELRIKEVSGRPRKEYAPKPRLTLELLPPSQGHNGGIPCVMVQTEAEPRGCVLLSCPLLSLFCPSSVPLLSLFCPSSVPLLSLAAPMDQPCCRALYDFLPENEGELGFKEGDAITLTNQIDDNWYEGMIHGQSGFFPINYVDILVPLPH
ncbi:endophilin-A1-like isoform X6 [Limanda limanda]|uniref:endophilin-A1-like isoform X6 n=1 Tax=Limanda limanda TaxID=27771 RepID=UPI0029C76E67|nr:endophilin-A1-like isoform X6 [Limanda limanda]